MLSGLNIQADGTFMGKQFVQYARPLRLPVRSLYGKSVGCVEGKISLVRATDSIAFIYAVITKYPFDLLGEVGSEPP